MDLAADSSFAEAVRKVREHYGIEVSAAQVRTLTYRHGAGLEEQTQTRMAVPSGGVSRMLGEIDGSLIPIVRSKPGAGDRRRLREVGWREVKLSLVRRVGAVRGRYGATLGSVDEAGQQWRQRAIEAGFGTATRMHCVGDGAGWIAAQVTEQFGSQGSYLIDFYHVSEYLAKAGAEIVGQTQLPVWLHRQQDRLKQNHLARVLDRLRQKQEAPEVADDEAPIRKCLRYLENREAYLDYQGALNKGLPIGSGEIESSHRTVVQARLKIAGAWWKEENAKKMLALRTCRANDEWDNYWKEVFRTSS